MCVGVLVPAQTELKRIRGSHGGRPLPFAATSGPLRRDRPGRDLCSALRRGAVSNQHAVLQLFCF